jgi:hypothetical protein
MKLMDVHFQGDRYPPARFRGAAERRSFDYQQLKRQSLRPAGGGPRAAK